VDIDRNGSSRADHARRRGFDVVAEPAWLVDACFVVRFLHGRGYGAAGRAKAISVGRLRSLSQGVCLYKAILLPKLGITARNEFFGALLCLLVVSALHIDRVRNMPVFIDEIGPILRHYATPEVNAYLTGRTGEHAVMGGLRP
jgi:hypothetical protein